MKIGNYDLGQPIDFGFTSEQQLYYCSNSIPSSGNYKEVYEKLSELYNTSDTSDSEFILRRLDNSGDGERFFDTNQQYKSPGTSFGYGSKQQTDEAPYNPDQLFTGNVDSQGNLEYFSSTLLQQNLVNPSVLNRYNHNYHSSLYTELLLHNVNVVENTSDINVAGNINPMELITKALFTGRHLGPFTSDENNLFRGPFEFVPAGIPYVKFRINSKFKHNGIGSSTSLNQQGVIEYYVLMRTLAHSGVTEENISDNLAANPNGIYQLVTEESLPSSTFNDFLSNNFSVESLTINDINSLTTLSNITNVVIPTIVGEFQNPMYSITWEDCIQIRKDSLVPAGGSAFTFPGRHNPNNLPNKAPNYGWHPGQTDTPLVNKTEAELIQDYQKYLTTFAWTGNHPLFFTIDNFYVQDFDLLGIMGDDESVHEQIFDDAVPPQDSNPELVNQPLLRNHNAILNLAGQLSALGDDESGVPIYQETIQKLYLMAYRLSIYGLINIQFNFLEAENSDTDIGDIWDVSYVCYAGGLKPFPIDDESDYLGTSQMLPINYNRKNLKRMFGPSAPAGYQPKCGTNYRSYFNLPEGVEIDENNTDQTNVGNTQFIFNGGLNVGSQEAIGTILGYDTTQLLENYQADISDGNAINLLDLELWKLFYDAQNLNVRIETSIRDDYTGGTNNPFNNITIPPTPLYAMGIPRNPSTNFQLDELLEVQFHSNPKGFAGFEAQGLPSPVVQWPFEDFDINENDGDFGLSQVIQQLYTLPYDSAGGWDFVDTIDDFGGNTSPPFVEPNFYFRDIADYVTQDNLSLSYFENVLFSNNPGFRIYRVRKITENDDDFNLINLQGQFPLNNSQNFIDYNPYGTYQTNIDDDGLEYFWYVEGFVEINSMSPEYDTGFDLSYFANPNLTYVNSELGKPINSINNFNPDSSDVVLKQGEYYVFETPYGGNLNNVGSNSDGSIEYDHPTSTTFSSIEYLNPNALDAYTKPGFTPFDDSTLALFRRHPADYSLSYIAQNNILTSAEFEKFSFCHKVNLGLESFTNIYYDNIHYYYHHIVRFFTPPSQTQFNIPNPLSAPYNPYVDSLPINGNDLIGIGNFFTEIRDFLIQLPFQQGGIANWEIENWITWLNSGCTGEINNIAPALTSNYNSQDLVDEYGSFQAPTTQVIGMEESAPPPDGSRGTPGGTLLSTILFTKSERPATNWWEVCDYLNQFTELQDGSIDFITFRINNPDPVFTGIETDVLVFTSLPYTHPSGWTIQKGFYPSNPESIFLDSFMAPQTEIFIKMNNYNFIETEAFGPPPIFLNNNQRSYTSGTPFILMIQNLIEDGIEGTTIDIFPEDDGPNSPFRGIYSIMDGRIYLERSIRRGDADYRPLQLITFAIQNNLLPSLYYFLPPTSQVDVDDTPYLPGLEPSNPLLTPIPPRALGIFDGRNSAAIIRTDESYDYTRHNSGPQGYLPGTGPTGMSNSDLEDNGYQNKKNYGLFGQNMFTQSTNPTNHPYYFTMTNGEPDKASSLETFDVSWGHIDGSGSLKKGHTKSPSEAVYRQAANELLGGIDGQGQDGVFLSLSQSIQFPGTPDYMQTENPTPDEYVWILRTKNYLQQDSCFHRDITINLSGSNSAGNGVNVKLGTIGTDTNFAERQSNGLTRYFLGKDGVIDNGCYGYFYPQIGTILINPKISEDIDGVGATTVTQFNVNGPSHNGMLPNGLSKNDKEYNNALKLVNVLKNKNGNEKSISNEEPALHMLKIVANNGSFPDVTSVSHPSTSIIACIRLRPDEFNFTTNPTRFKNLGETGEYDTFPANGNGLTAAGIETMKYSAGSDHSPTTYITHVDLYDKFGYRIATAKLSKPIRKDFNSAVVIKILLNTH